MSNKIYLFILIAITSIACTSKEVTDKPNIIFIFADDQAYNTIGAYGHPEIKTPHLDKLVEQGTSFTHAYNMGSWTDAVCMASRSMINTGRFVWHAFDLESKQDTYIEEGKMWSQIMGSSGYNTYMTGKWHVKAPAHKIFDTVVHVRPGMPRDAFDHAKQMRLFNDSVLTGFVKAEEIMPNGYYRPKSVKDKSWLPWDTSKGGYWEGGKHWSEVLADDAIGFIDHAKDQSEPFFMYLAFNAPHDPRQAPKEYIEMYSPNELSIPESFNSKYPFADSIGCGPKLRDAALAPFPRTEYAIKVQKQEYFALISHLDAQIGKIIKSLEETDQLKNTYIFYTADHGLAVGEHGLLGKQNMYDHSIRAPLFVVGPNVPSDKNLSMDVYLQDIMASCIDIAGIEKPHYIEFNSLMPYINGEKTESVYDAIYGCYTYDLQRMIRKDGYKLIVYPHGKTVRLYDMVNDPNEINDLANNDEYKLKLNQLYTDLLSLQESMDDPLDLTKYFGNSL